MLVETVIPMILILLVLVAINAPIWVALLGATVYLQVFVNDMSLQNLFTGLFEAMTKNSLLAVPFFVVAGTIIANSTLGSRLINIFIATLKNVRGGLPISCLISNAIFGAISGSAPAATATFGKVVHEPLTKAHGKKLSLGLITSSGALSTIIPPSITMIIYGIATEQSITELFMGGFLPGILVVIIIGIYLVVVCKQNAFAGEKTSLKEIKTALKQGVVVIILPVIVLGGIYSGLCTPTESGAIAALYSFIVAVFFLKDIKPSQLLKVFKESSITTAQIFLLIGVSTVFAQAATIAQLPAFLTDVFSGLTAFQFLLILNVLLLIVGCFFDSAAAILILAPMLLPPALALGINPLHLGIVFTVNLSIGMFTPPFGLNIFVTQSVLKCSMAEVSKAVIPFIVLYIIALLIITYIPGISLFLPNLLAGF